MSKVREYKGKNMDSNTIEVVRVGVVIVLCECTYGRGRPKSTKIIKVPTLAVRDCRAVEETSLYSGSDGGRGGRLRRKHRAGKGRKVDELVMPDGRPSRCSYLRVCLRPVPYIL